MYEIASNSAQPNVISYNIDAQVDNSSDDELERMARTHWTTSEDETNLKDESNHENSEDEKTIIKQESVPVTKQFQ